MGYDMYWVDCPPDIEAENKLGWDRFHEAVAYRDSLPQGSVAAKAAQDQVHAAWPEQPNYFRANIWGMSELREEMAAQGMLVLEYDQGSRPEFPEDGTYNEDDEDGWDKAAKPTLIWTPHDPPHGIPIHKFSGNDGWIVTPLEIKAALFQAQHGSEFRGSPTSEHGERPPTVPIGGAEEIGATVFKMLGAEAASEDPFATIEDIDPEWWQEWLTWMGQAADHGGFAVH